MSHYTSIQTKMADLEALTYAVESMGFKVKVGKNQSLYNYLGEKTSLTADLVIPKRQITSASNDIGFSQENDGTYKLIISDYDKTIPKTRDFPEQIKQRYAYFKVKKELMLENKEIIQEKIHDNGIIEIVVEG